MLRSIRSLASAALAHYPFYTGLESIALSKPLALLARNEHFAIVRLRNGLQMLVFAKDHVGRILLYMGDFDRRISFVAERLLSAGDTVLDIGANQGWFSLIAAPLVGAEGQVHGFEPQPQLASLFRASVTMNGLTQVSVQDFALSDSEGTATLYVLHGNLGAGRLSVEEGKAWSGLEVRTCQAGQALSATVKSPIRMMKIDVEGHETTILEAAKDFFKSNPPDVLIFESCADGTPVFERPVYKLVANMGYRIFGFESTKLTPRLREMKSSAWVESNDYVAFFDGPKADEDLKALAAIQGKPAA